ncbi:hypothetical protein PHYBLDRAFT_98547, partial [Phycomyces blakesleeanus NRRL 1555(-)]
VPDAYIIVFKPETKQETALSHYNEIEDIQQSEISHTNQNLDYGVIHKYEIGGFKGYSGKFSSSVIRIIQTYEEVDYIEQDKYVQAASIQNKAPWGLARISHRKRLNNMTFDKFIYEDDGGEYVTVYILDTGIYEEHEDFEDRASWGVNFLRNSPDIDIDGHGTHSAGIIGGKIHGVAKMAKLVAVKVLDDHGTGTVSTVIAGINWVSKSHQYNIQQSCLHPLDSIYKGAVATLNFFTTKSVALNQAVNIGTYHGITIVVPAGNTKVNACEYSPASATEAITVGASTYYDAGTSFSNFGDCVDIYAPGQNILSAWNSGRHAKKVHSGTSEAASHVAGLAAYYASM